MRIPDTDPGRKGDDAPERGIGDNGGPRLEPRFTPKRKLARIQDILEMDITAAQKCVGIGIVVQADEEGVSSDLPTRRLLAFASVADPETVYRATKVLKAQHVAEPVKVKGKPNSYRILPPRVIDAIVEAYNSAKKEKATGRVQSEVGSPVEPDGSAPPTGRVEPDMVLRSDRTTPAEPVGLDRTGQKKRSPRTPLKENYSNYPTTLSSPSSLEAARDDDEKVQQGLEFSKLNGCTSDLVRFIGEHAKVDENSARNMLATNVRIFGAEPLLEAYALTIAKMPTGLVARPYQYLIESARGCKAKTAKRVATAAESSTEARERILDEAADKVRAEMARRGK